MLYTQHMLTPSKRSAQMERQAFSRALELPSSPTPKPNNFWNPQHQPKPWKLVTKRRTKRYLFLQKDCNYLQRPVRQQLEERSKTLNYTDLEFPRRKRHWGYQESLQRRKDLRTQQWGWIPPVLSFSAHTHVWVPSEYQVLAGQGEGLPFPQGTGNHGVSLSHTSFMLGWYMCASENVDKNWGTE